MMSRKGYARREALQRSAEREWRRVNQAAYCADRDARTKREREINKAVARAERGRES